jgi:hypothetical protein
MSPTSLTPFSGNFHILFHDFNGTVNGGHAFATDWAGPWHYTGAPAYNHSVDWAAGESRVYPPEVDSRERPMLYVDPASGTPSVLFTGVVPGPGSAWGRSFTMAAVVHGSS